MVTIKLSLDKRKVKKDNTYPICFRIYDEGASTTKSSKIDVKEEHWNENKKCIRRSHPNAVALNKLLVERMNDLQDALSIEKVHLPTDPLTTIEVNEPILLKISVYRFAETLIQELRLDNKIGNPWVYEATMSALAKYHPEPKLYFEQIDYRFLDKYNKFLLRGGAKPNTAFWSCYI